MARGALVAAAKSYYPKNKRGDDLGNKQPGEWWQHQGWEFYDSITEFGQAAVIQGALLSRAKLIVEEKGDDGVWRQTKNPAVASFLDELYGGEEGHSDMLRLLGIHLTVSGEAWIISPEISKIGTSTAGDWTVAASTNASKTSGKWRVAGKVLEGDRFAIRIWRPHPVDKKKADSPTRRLIPDLSEMLQLKKRIAAQIDSRLAGAGVWFIPAEASFSSLPTQVANPGDPPTVKSSVQPGDAQGLADLLLEQARRAVQNPEDAEAMIPIIAEVPGEDLEKIQAPINFWSELDRAAPKLRAEIRETIARGMDIPAEVLLGGQGSSHWNMWLSDENNIKIHAEPALKIITDGLTIAYLRRGLEDTDEVDPEKFRISSDTSSMRLRPNRSKEALELNDRLILSDEAAIRENGFTEEDLMDEEGIKKALLRRAASGSTTPELVAAALRELGVDVPQITDHRPPAEARPNRTLRDHPVREIPEQRDPAPADVTGVVFAAEQMVDRALQRIGNRYKSRMRMKESPVPANRLYQAVELTDQDVDEGLNGAWECVSVGDYGIPGPVLSRALDVYTRSLIRSRHAPSRAALSGTLKLLMSNSAA